MTKKTKQELEAEFYARPLLLSYSGLNKMLYSPSLYYKHYVLQEQEEKLDSYLIDGKVIHCLLLDDGSFDRQFMLMPSVLPTENTRRLVDAIYAKANEEQGLLENYTVEILEYLKDVKLHQALADDKKAPFKTGDEKRLEKILTEDAKSYFEFLKIKGNKDLLDSVTMQRCTEAVEVLRNHAEVRELLGLMRSEMDNIDVYNEIFMAVDHTDKPFGLKGVVDNVKIDHDAKIIYVNDLKTTGKTIVDFPETIDFYNYWAQAAVYERLVAYEYVESIIEGYKIVFNFVVIDRYQQVYVFEVSKDTLAEWQIKLEEKLEEAAWHYNEKNYNLPYKFAKTKVIL
jgi:hypothetical protein